MIDTVLLMPGINNSGPTHWQTLWEAENPTFQRIQVADWDHPVCADWVDTIERTVARAGGPLVVVAHSLGCLPVVEWSLQSSRGQTQKIAGMLLVSVPDPQGPNFPAEASGFARPRLARLPFASIVASSEDDPFGAPEYARACAAAWGSRFVNVGAAGHINANSGLGAWPEGQALLASLRSASTASTPA